MGEVSMKGSSRRVYGEINMEVMPAGAAALCHRTY
jgi:hypothetical protein